MSDNFSPRCSDHWQVFVNEVVKLLSGRLTGFVMVKLNSGAIVYIEKNEKLLSNGEVRDKDKEILAMECFNFVKKLRGLKFYGEVIIVLRAGRIIEVSVARKYRAETLPRFDEEYFVKGLQAAP